MIQNSSNSKLDRLLQATGIIASIIVFLIFLISLLNPNNLGIQSAFRIGLWLVIPTLLLFAITSIFKRKSEKTSAKPTYLLIALVFGLLVIGSIAPVLDHRAEWSFTRTMLSLGYGIWCINCIRLYFKSKKEVKNV